MEPCKDFDPDDILITGWSVCIGIRNKIFNW
jgi:hypothetical protein